MNFGFAVLLSGFAIAASAATPEEAASLFEAKKWQDAAAAYQELVSADPANANAWLRLAQARAAAGETGRALEALQSGAATGQLVYQAVMAAPELTALHGDARFRALIEPLKPCTAAEYRHFDFWLGDWDESSTPSPGRVSRNRNSRINDGSNQLELYTTPTGYAGTRMKFYDATLKLWHQTWIDNQGGALYLEGSLQGKSMVLSTTAGKESVQRITWTPLDDGRVRQHWEATTDAGKTWSTVFDGYYAKRAGP
jgi:tetratricopeptide (TPR) repeat protein